MKISDAKIFIKNLAEKQVPIVPLLVGGMGIGKSQIVKQVADELGIGLVDLRLAQLESGDLVGIPYQRCSHECKATKDGSVIHGMHRTEHAMPSWWPEPGTKGILFLDELNRAPNDVRQSIFQLILDKRLHTHVLPEGWIVVSAINPDTNEYQVETLDKAMIRRFCVIGVNTDVETWLAWATGNGKIRKEVVGFVSNHKEMLAENESLGENLEARPAPDQYRQVNMLLEAGAIPKANEFEIFSGLLGKTAATAFRKWLDSNYSRPVNGEDVIKKYHEKEIKEKLAKQRNDEMYSTITELAAWLENNKKLGKRDLENLKAFILDVGDEFKATVVKRLPKDLLPEIVVDEKLTDIVASALREASTNTKGKK